MFIPIDMHSVAKTICDGFDAIYDENERKEKELEEIRREKERRKEMKKLWEREENERLFKNLLIEGDIEKIELYFQRTWMFDHFDLDRLCVYNPYGGDGKWHWYSRRYCD